MGRNTAVKNASPPLFQLVTETLTMLAYPRGLKASETGVVVAQDLWLGHLMCQLILKSWSIFLAPLRECAKRFNWKYPILIGWKSIQLSHEGETCIMFRDAFGRTRKASWLFEVCFWIESWKAEKQKNRTWWGALFIKWRGMEYSTWIHLYTYSVRESFRRRWQIWVFWGIPQRINPTIWKWVFCCIYLYEIKVS